MPSESRVAVVECERADYGEAACAIAAPELPGRRAASIPLIAVRRVLELLDLDRPHFGSAEWNPLGDLVRAGGRILLKPNWVLDRNASGGGMECLVTHTAFIEAVLQYVLLAKPGSVVIGDAPVQGCDFDALARICGFQQLLHRYSGCGIPISIADFRRTKLAESGAERKSDCRGMEHYVLFDLAHESLLEEFGADASRFRVTMYDPTLLNRTHGPGRHQYLIAREAMEADLVINLPKLKCHKKAGITGALKNLVGINGHKEYLPHHRKGGEADGGDCYEGSSWLKRRAEDLLDQANHGGPGTRQAVLARTAGWLARKSGDGNLEGSWYGNDTVWRMSLDLQRILLYGDSSGKLGSRPARQTLHVTDAIVAGEGNGPLEPSPVECGFVTGSRNAAAAEWVHARLMGFEPRRIPIVAHAFDDFAYPIADFAPESIEAILDGARVAEDRLSPFDGRAFRPADGWVGHVEPELVDE